MAQNKLLIYIAMTLLPCAALAQSKRSDAYFGDGVELYRSGQYEQAIPYFEKAWELDRREIAPESNRYIYSRSWLASCYYKSGNKAKARELSAFDCDMEPVDRRLTVEADREGDMSNRAYMAGDIDGAIQHAIRCLELERKMPGDISFHITGSYAQLGDLYMRVPDARSALKYYNEGVQIVRKLNCESSIMLFQLLMGRSHASLMLGDAAMAGRDADELIAIARTELAENGNEYPMALVNSLLGQVALANQQFGEAGDMVARALKSFVAMYSEPDEEIIIHIIDCLTTLSMLGRYDDSIALIKAAIAQVEANGADSRHLGILYSYMGEFSATVEESIVYLRKSLSLLEGKGNEADYYPVAALLAKITDRAESVSIYNSIIDYCRRNGIESGFMRNALMSLGDIYDREGRYDLAIDYYLEIFDLLGPDKDNPDRLLTVVKFATIALKYMIAYQGEFTGEIRGFNLAEEFSETFSRFSGGMQSQGISFFTSRGIGPVQIADAMLSFYRLLLSKATINPVISWSEMERQLSLLCDGLTEIYGYDHHICNDAMAALAHVKYVQGDYKSAIDSINAIITRVQKAGGEVENYRHDLAYYQYDSGDTAGAYENFEAGYNFNKNLILANYRWMTLEERDAYTRTHRGNIDNIPHYAALTPSDSRYAALAYNALLFSKGLLLNSTIELSRLLQEAGDKETLSMLDRWRSANQKYRRAQDEEHPDAEKFKAQCEQLERRLMERSTVYGDYTAGLTVEYPQVQQALGRNDVAVEFFSYRLDARSLMYGALLLTADRAPIYVPVGIDSDWSGMMADCYKSPELFNTIFAGLKQYLPRRDAGSIYFAADGVLHTLAIENMSGAEDYDFRRLSSTRELALADGGADAVCRMAVYGGIKYGVGKLAEYYRTPGDGKRESGAFLAYLPETEVEADDIHSLLAGRIKVDRLTAEKATETSFKSLSGKRIDLLHVATHGFFEHPAVSSDISQFTGRAMASSGLFFAGAQNTLWGEDTGMKEDGILTADEISLLDFRGLRLAVLSACDTGRGLYDSDGVFGLQRGFKQAGTGSLMMSLWKVDDKATQLLMGEFYRRLLEGKSQYEALQAARQTVRNSYPDPQYWAAFVLVDALNNIKI